MDNNFLVERMEKKQFGKTRVFHLDLLRTIACLCVIMIHSSADYVVRDFGTSNFWIGNVFDSISRVGVPLFVMISGAIFLDEKYQLTYQKLKGHILKIVSFFIFWSLFYSTIYNLVIPLIKNQTISFKGFISALIRGNYHLWFCFMIVGLYLITPLLRLWVKKENIKYIIYFLILSAIFTMFLPSLLYFLVSLNPSLENNILDDVNLRYVGGYTVYFILGWLLNNYKIKFNKTIIVLGCIGVLVSIFGTAILSINLNEAHQTYDNLSLHVAFQSIMIFSLVTNKFKDNSEIGSKAKRVVVFIAKYSLGIYGMHVVFLSLATKFLVFDSSIIQITVSFSASFVFSLLFSFLISKIPFFKKFV